MRRSPRTSLSALVLAALAVIAAGCGGGAVAAGEVPGNPPAITVRSDGELAAGGTDATAQASATADAGSGAAAGSATPEPGATAAPDGGTPTPATSATPDGAATSPDQPAAGSAPQQFESFCEQNAGAC